jgi:CRISPR-associated RAMP protein (TIGR02581 family)
MMNTDSPIVRTPEELPFIPGSSFKGAFRSTVEKIAVSLPNITTCQLIEDEKSKNCPTAYHKEFAKQVEKMKDEKELVETLKEKLCNTCKLFGSPYTASKIFFHDLKILDWAGVTQVRDGVVIDRDSERAKDKLKYDFEVVAPSSTFDMEIWLENPSKQDLGLACIGLNEYLSGMGYIGGIKSRGLGSCFISDLKVYKLDLESEGKEERLRKYLIHTEPEKKMDEIKNPEQFVQEKTEAILLSKEV